jgi:hypothetical protein
VLALLEVGEVGALIFTKVDRASRCTEDFAWLIRLSEEQGWRLIVTEIGIDTRTPMGRAMAHMAVVFAELERDFIRSRTREALAVRRDHGVVLGRPRSTAPPPLAPGHDYSDCGERPAGLPIRCVGEVCGPLLVLQPQFLVRSVCGRSAQSAGVQTFLPSREQLTELLDCRQLAGTDLIVLAVRGFGDTLSDGDEPFVHLGALIRWQ